jgi:hypothetical protein
MKQPGKTERPETDAEDGTTGDERNDGTTETERPETDTEDGTTGDKRNDGTTETERPETDTEDGTTGYERNDGTTGDKRNDGTTETERPETNGTTGDRDSVIYSPDLNECTSGHSVVDLWTCVDLSSTEEDVVEVGIFVFKNIFS